MQTVQKAISEQHENQEAGKGPLSEKKEEGTLSPQPGESLGSVTPQGMHGAS